MRANRLKTYVLLCTCFFVLLYLLVFQPSEESVDEPDIAFSGSVCGIASKTLIGYTHLDLRIILITFNRPKSLLRLLRSLNNARYNGDNVGIDIWLDRSKNGTVSKETIKTVLQFHFTAGLCRLYVRDHHGGLKKQWLEVKS